MSVWFAATASGGDACYACAHAQGKAVARSDCGLPPTHAWQCRLVLQAPVTAPSLSAPATAADPSYFLLCGYTPFDRESQYQEMQAICNGDYKFAPAEYWAGVSETAKAFVRACLTVDPVNRPTAADLLQHPWLKSEEAPFVQDPEKPSGESVNLLPNVKKAFDAKKTREPLCAAVTDTSPSRCSGNDDGQPATGSERTAPEHGWHARGGTRASASRGRRVQGGGREGEWLAPPPGAQALVEPAVGVAPRPDIQLTLAGGRVAGSYRRPDCPRWNAYALCHADAGPLRLDGPNGDDGSACGRSRAMYILMVIVARRPR